MKAVNIEWDFDNEEDTPLLPTEIEIPKGLEDEDEISDYLSDVTGFCHKGFHLIEDATFISMWDGGTCIETGCKVNLITGEIFDIEVSEGSADFINNLDGEYIRFADGTEFIIDQSKVDGGFWYGDDDSLDMVANRPSLDSVIQSASSHVEKALSADSAKDKDIYFDR